MMTRKDLTQDEWNWLLKIYQHNAPFLTVAMNERLTELGLVEQRLGGAGVSPEGKKLVEREIIAARRVRERG